MSFVGLSLSVAVSSIRIFLLISSPSCVQKTIWFFSPIVNQIWMLVDFATGNGHNDPWFSYLLLHYLLGRLIKFLAKNFWLKLKNFKAECLNENTPPLGLVSTHRWHFQDRQFAAPIRVLGPRFSEVPIFSSLSLEVFRERGAPFAHIYPCTLETQLFERIWFKCFYWSFLVKCGYLYLVYQHGFQDWSIDPTWMHSTRGY